MKLIKEYLCDYSTPSDDEIMECLKIVNNEDCIVKLTWFFPYNGWHKLFVKRGMTFEECEKKLPKCYGI